MHRHNQKGMKANKQMQKPTQRPFHQNQQTAQTNMDDNSAMIAALFGSGARPTASRKNSQQAATTANTSQAATTENISIIRNFDLPPTWFNASKSKAEKMITTLGINIPMISFLEPLEQVELQLGNKFCYNIAVSRVQYKVQQSELFFFVSPTGDELRRSVLVYDAVKKEHFKVTSCEYFSGKTGI